MNPVLDTAGRHSVKFFALVAVVLISLASLDSQARDKAPVRPGLQERVEIQDTAQAQEHINKGLEFGNAGAYDKAIAEFQKAVKFDRKNAQAYSNLGVAYFKLGNYDAAIASYGKAIAFAGADANNYFYRGLMYGKYKQKHAEAIKDYSQSIKLQPKETRGYLNRGLSYLALKMNSKAVADFNKVVEIQPEDRKNILEPRARAYFEMHEYKKAWADVQKAKELGVGVDADFVEKLAKASPQKG